MINFFPSPYPDELWYSTLSRYHHNSGNIGVSSTIKELFDSPNLQPSIFFINQNFGGLFERLPLLTLDKMQVVQQHTLIPYVLRFASEKKKSILQSFIAGDSPIKTGNSLFSIENPSYLRFCPLCNKEDLARYGELYWHRSLQIPLLSLCPIHYCNLENSFVEITPALGRKFILPTEKNCPTTKGNFISKHYDKALAHTIATFISRPLVQESGFWCAVFSQSLKNTGYYLTEVESHLIYKNMLQYYGEALIKRYFPPERIQSTIYRMLKGQWVSPEQYALLSTFLEINPSWLTTPGNYLEDTMEAKLKEMAATGYLWKKQRVAETLGVTTWALDAIIKRLGLKPFWKTWNDPPRRDDVYVRIRISKEEKEHCIQRAEELGIADLTEYVRYYVKKSIER